MIDKNLLPYANKKWASYKDSITNISKDGQGESLVVSKKLIYHFDGKIIPAVFKKNVPYSADGIAVTRNRIMIIEFKKGFKDKVTTNKFSEKQGKCNKIEPPIICQEKWELFFSKREKETKELITSLKLKAVETYITLEKHIFPKCPPGKKIIIDYIAVIDGDEEDGEIDTWEKILGVKKRKSKVRNIFAEVKNSLKRLKISSSKKYYYDNIEVLSSVEFLEKINNYK